MTVSYTESPIFRLAKEISEKGYKTASCTGLSQRLFHAKDLSIGLLKPRPPKRGFLGRLKRQRANFLGVIWLDNLIRDAKPNKRWVFEVYGRTHLEEAKKLAEDLASKFKVGIQIQLEAETEKEETYLSDYDY